MNTIVKLVLGAMAALTFGSCNGDDHGRVLLPMPTVPQHSPKAAIEAVRDTLAAGNPAALWAALPQRYRDDVNFLVREFAAKMDPEIYDEGVRLAGRLVRVFDDKRDFLAGSRMLSSTMPDDEATWDSTIDVFALLLESELATVDGLRTFDGGEFLRGTGATAMKLFDRVARQKGHSLAELTAATITVVRDEHEHPVLRLAADGEQHQDLEFTRVDGKWLPLQLVKGWDEAMTSARAGLAEMPDMNTDAAVKGQSRMALGMLRGIVEQLEQADSRQEFEQALLGVGGMMMGAAGAPR